MIPVLSIQNLSTGYGKKQVLFDVSLEVAPGEILLVTGGNGSGKSTLLKAIYGLLSPWNADAGIIFRPEPNGPPLNTRQASNNLRSGLAYLPQKGAVFGDLTVEDNLRLSGHTLRDVGEIAARREEVLVLIPALRHLLCRKPEKMSGGERQMVALAMVLLHRPKLVLLDEPTAGLEETRAAEIFQILASLKKTAGLSAIVVEHRVGLVEPVADRVTSMRLGMLQNFADYESTKS